jgi:hypothetical protein
MRYRGEIFRGVCKIPFRGRNLEDMTTDRITLVVSDTDIDEAR